MLKEKRVWGEMALEATCCVAIFPFSFSGSVCERESFRSFPYFSFTFWRWGRGAVPLVVLISLFSAAWETKTTGMGWPLQQPGFGLHLFRRRWWYKRGRRSSFITPRKKKKKRLLEVSNEIFRRHLISHYFCTRAIFSSLYFYSVPVFFISGEDGWGEVLLLTFFFYLT